MNSRSVRRSISWDSLNAKLTIWALPSRVAGADSPVRLRPRLRPQARAELLLVDELLDAAVAAALGIAADQLRVLRPQVVPGLVVVHVRDAANPLLGRAQHR